MTTRRSLFFWLCIQATVAVIQLGAADTGPEQSPPNAQANARLLLPQEPDPYSVVGVCPIPQGNRTWAIAWHYPDEVDQTSAVRVQKLLQGSDFDDCLVTLITTDPETAALASNVKPEAPDEDLIAMTKGVKRRWGSFGVDRAILEVMKEGRRGEQVQLLLRACEQLRQKE